MTTFNFSIKMSLINNKKFKIVLAFSFFLTLILAGLIGVYSYYQNKMYPGTYIDNVKVEGLTKSEVGQILNKNNQKVDLHTITINVDDIYIASNSTQLGAQKDYENAITSAYKYGKDSSITDDISILLASFSTPKHFTSITSYQENEIKHMVQRLKERVDIQGTHPGAELAVSGSADSLVIDPGSDGRSLDIENTLDLIKSATSHPDSITTSPITNIPNITISANVASTSAQLTEQQILEAKDRITHFIDKKTVFSTGYTTLKLTDQEIVSLLSLPQGISDEKLNILATGWEQRVSREPQNAEFEYNPDTLEVTSFAPHLDGLTLNVEKTKQQIIKLINDEEFPQVSLQTNISSPSAETPDATSQENQWPESLPLHLASQSPITTLSDTNKIGINEIIGFGDSNYDHSIPGRIHNVALTAKKINTTIVAPGNEFSFNKTLGDVSQATGFKPAYVIKNGATELGDGGGVCQVSTTLFRSLLNAGLPITKRKPHSYRVSYYELNQKPGIDATVYSGDVDLRFINDTGKHVLIHTETDSDNLYMKVEIYGTSDGRTSEIVDHKTWGAVPPLATQYIPDSSLPTGKLRQIDWSAAGIKASFRNVVKNKDGVVISDEEYVSNYRPWAAKYLRGV